MVGHPPVAGRAAQPWWPESGHAAVVTVGDCGTSASAAGVADPRAAAAHRHPTPVPLWRAQDLMIGELRALQQLAAQRRLEGKQLLRLEVRVGGVGVEEAMLWLRSQSMVPRIFFLNPDSSLLSAGCGQAHRVSGNGDLPCALVREGTPPAFRYFGGSRFDLGAQVGQEWADFGGHFFVLPQLELVYTVDQPEPGPRRGQGEAEWEQRSTAEKSRSNLHNCTFTLAVNARAASGDDWPDALARALQAVEQMRVTFGMERDLPTPLSMGNGTSFEDWKSSVEKALAELGKGGELRKVVLSRNFFVQFGSDVDPMDLLLKLRVHNGYLFLLQPSPSAAFLGCSPEPLFRISHDMIETMAISGTRPRGKTPEADAALAQELLASDKDKYENGVTTKYIQEQLRAVATDVKTSDVFIMKLQHVQHICRRISARPAHAEGSSTRGSPIGLLMTLNPTPAVCGESRPLATQFIRQAECFDRGFFGGPVGYVSATMCEFLVAIRSVLCQPRTLHIFAGAGIVPGSDPTAEWEETGLKMRNIKQLVAQPRPLRSLPNINTLWAALLIEELCRCGVRKFVVCPGARSTPLAVAVGRNSKVAAQVLHDERSAGFWAVGYGRAVGRPAAVIVTSGTAVANLLPAAVEAAQQGVPLVLLTADRPYELRECGSNQTIVQTGIFGGYARWARDMPCPSDQVPVATLLSDIDYAVHCAVTCPRGPVHLNLQLRENLAPETGPIRDALPGTPGGETGCVTSWRTTCIETADVARWELSSAPHALYHSHPASSRPELPREMLDMLRSARKGLIVVGSLPSKTDTEAVEWLVGALQWPVWADIQSGLRTSTSRSWQRFGVPALDQLLTSPHFAAGIRPDLVLQLGERLVSKRVMELVIRVSASEGCCKHVVVSDAPGRQDPSATASMILNCSALQLAKALSACSVVAPEQAAVRSKGVRSRTQVGGWPSVLLPLCDLSQRCMVAMERRLAAKTAWAMTKLEEPWVAVQVARKGIRPDGALFISSSMPIRYLDMYASVVGTDRQTVVIGSNRGASGIDGVLSSALGFCCGLARPVTLLIGDTALLHDIGALNAVASARHALTIVVVNNGGCGIFNFLPVAKHGDVFEKYFANPHSTNLEAAAATFHIKFARAASPAELDAALEETSKAGQHVLIEAVTAMGDMVPAHKELSAAARRVAEELLEDTVDLSYHWHGIAIQGRPVVVLLHGFLGSSADWDPFLAELAKQEGKRFSYLVVDLPGHGASGSGRGELPQSLAVSWESTVALLFKLLDRLRVTRCALVGYSLGGRLALQMVAQNPQRFWAVCSLAGNVGLEDSTERLKRRDADDVLAQQLRAIAHGASSETLHYLQAVHSKSELFAEEASAQRKDGVLANGAQHDVRWREWLYTWYKQPLFGDLSRAPSFPALLQRRQSNDASVMADVLEGCSPGRVPSTWSVVEGSGVPLMFVHGAADTKFAAIGQEIQRRAGKVARQGLPTSAASGDIKGDPRKVEVVSIEGAAHALLEEAPEASARALASFLQGLAGDACQAHCVAYRIAEREPLMVASACVRTFTLRLTEPLQLSSGGALTSRQGSLLELGTMSGHVGLGECTPLPGFHKETYEEAHAQLLLVADLLNGRIIPDNLSLLKEGAIAEWLFAPQRYPHHAYYSAHARVQDIVTLRAHAQVRSVGG